VESKEESDEESGKDCSRCNNITSDARDYCSEGPYFRGWCKMNSHKLLLCDECFSFLDNTRPDPIRFKNKNY
jgi:hypothetical protein